MLMALFKVSPLAELACHGDQLVTPITAQWKALLSALHPVPAVRRESRRVSRSLS